MIIMRPEAAVTCSGIMGYSMYSLAQYVRYIYTRLSYAEQDSPSLDMILLGPAFSNVVSKRKLREEKNQMGQAPQSLQADSAV